MSLINQMLQDLEERRADGMAAAGMHEQVRAVAARNRTHMVWWLALIPTVLLIGIAAWLWLRPAAHVAAPAPLALKFAPGLASTPPVPENLAAESKDAGQGAMPAPTAPALPSAPPTATSTADSQAASAPPEHLVAGTQAVAGMPAVAPASDLIAAIAAPKPITMPAKPAEAGMALGVNKQIKELSPLQRAENQYRKAGTLMQQGRTSDAIMELEQALQLDPLHTAARQTLAGLLLDGKRADDAIRKLQEGLELDASQPGLAIILARLQVDKGELRLAIETLQRSLPYGAERVDYQAFLAALLQRDKRHKEAVEHYLTAVRKAPQNGVWWMGLGISLQAENRLQEAQEAFVRAKDTNSLSLELLAFVDQKLSQLQH